VSIYIEANQLAEQQQSILRFSTLFGSIYIEACADPARSRR